MTDVDHVDDDDQGDAPDTFDDRLADIIRLIDTDADDPAHHRQRVAIAVALLARLGADALTRIGEQLDRLELDT